MRAAIRIGILSGLVHVAPAQNSLIHRLPVPGVFARIHKLSIVSNDLPRAEQQSLVRAFQGGSYDLAELEERIRWKLRDSGYALADVSAPKVTRMRPDQTACRTLPPERVCDTDVRYVVHAGDQYRLGGITFTGTPAKIAFTTAQLRGEFPLTDGAIFNATEIGKGLENLKNLYASAGYINFGAIPKPVYDTGHHTVSFIVEMDQGRSFKFEKLLFEGIEPRAGIAKTLLTSWKDVEGRIYNPQLMNDWLKSTAPEWPPGTLQTAQFQIHEDFDGFVNVVLYFQCGTYPAICP